MSTIDRLKSTHSSESIRYRTFVWEQGRTLYVETPKAACTAIKTALMLRTNPNVAFERSRQAESSSAMLVHDRGLHPVPSLIDVPEALAEEALTSPEWFRFCVVRNPYERVFSGWFSKLLLAEPTMAREVRPGTPLPEDVDALSDVYAQFERFVEYLATNEKDAPFNDHWNLQWTHLFAGEIAFTTIARFESLDSSLMSWRTHLRERGIEQDGFARRNESGLRFDASRLHESTLARMKEIYARDFEAFGYPTAPPAPPARASEETERAQLVHIRATRARNQRIEELYTSREAALERVAALEASAAENESTRLELAAMRAELEETRDRNRELERTLTRIRSQASYRITAPLRQLHAKFLRNSPARSSIRKLGKFLKTSMARLSRHASSGTPTVSLTIPFLNGEKFLAEAIESVLAQTYSSWELLLVDDGSTDGSTAIARRYATEWPGKIRYLEHPGHQNRGMAASRNLGLRHSRGRYIARLDADDVLLPSMFEDNVAILESHGAAAMVYGPTQAWFSWSGAPGPADGIQEYTNAVPLDVVSEPPTILLAFLSSEANDPVGMFVRREVMDRLGGYPTHGLHENMYEDIALNVKICLHHPVFVSSKTWYRYRQHPDSYCAVMRRQNEYELGKLRYLEWVGNHLRENDVRDPAIWAVHEKALGDQIAFLQGEAAASALST